MLLDAEAYARGSSCTIDGPCHITSMPGEFEEDTSDGASDDSLHSSASPVYNRAAATGGGNGSAAAAAAGHKQAGPAKSQPLCRQAFKAAAAARAVAGNVMSGIRPGAAAAADLQSFGPTSPFGSSNGSLAGSAYELELGSEDDLVRPNMLVANKAAAAALFPAEHGAFAAPQGQGYGRC